MKITKKIRISISIILLSTVLASVFSMNNVHEVKAANRLQGVQQIVTGLNEDNKYTVLEIVPDKAFSSFGYYVSGYEPELDSKLIQSMLKYDVAGEITEGTEDGYSERKILIENYFKELQGNVVTFDSGYAYQETIQNPGNTNTWKVVTAAEGKTFKDIRKGYYLELEEELNTGDYILEDNKYIYTPEQGNYVWVDDDESETLYWVEFKSLYYQTSIVSEDWFAKRVLEIGSAVGEESQGPVTNHNIEVITVTPDELEVLLSTSSTDGISLEEIDLIYLSNSSCLSIPTENILYDSYDSNSVYTDEKWNDISWETAYSIFEYVSIRNLPIIVDDSIIPEVTNDNASVILAANNNIIRLAYLLKNYTETYDDNLKYTIDQYRLSDEPTYVIPSVLPDENVEEGEETKAQADTKIGRALSQSFSKYVNFENKLTDKATIVYASVFVNKSGKNIVHSAFSTDQETHIVDVTATSQIYGVQAVINEIHSENIHYHLESEDYTTEYTYDENEPLVRINQPTLLKYILNFQNRRIEVYKDKITVLDIEPTKYSTLTDDMVRTWITGTQGTVASSKIKEIEIIQTSTYEFIGKINDLNEEYDLIYFGSCVGDGYSSGRNDTRLHGSMNQDINGDTLFNDTALRGMIYTHVGDQVEIEYRAGGLLLDELTDETGDLQLEKDNITTRYSGNDITATKVEQLKEFVDSGYPVVISNKFYDGTNISKNCVDENSYMYEFMAYCVENKKANVIKESEILASVLSDYVNVPKLNLSLITQPDEYAITEEDGKITAVNYLQEVGNRNVLIYSFEFSNTSEANVQANNYEVELFVDINADGQFDDSEKLDSLEVMKTSNLEAVASDKLKTNTRYTVSRELPDSYVGIIPWQLKISMVEYDNSTPTKRIESRVRTTTEGFTAVKTTETTVVKVLQIASLQMAYQESEGYGKPTHNYYTGLILPYEKLLDDVSNGDEELNRWNVVYEDKDGNDIQYKDKDKYPQYDIEWVQISANNYVQRGNVEIPAINTFTNYFEDLNDYMGFDIQVDVISVNDYVKRALAADNTTAFYNTFYDKYDMIIMGFEDCYQDIASAEAVEAIEMFIKSGRSVLFAHDTTSYFNVERNMYDLSKASFGSGRPWYHWGYHWNRYVRSDVGMDRYGITENNLSILQGDVETGTVENLNESDWGTYVTDAMDLNKEIPYYSADETVGAKEMIAHEVHGFADGLIDEYRQSSFNTYIFTENDYRSSNGNSNPDSYYNNSITQVNKGQITTFPYDINIKQREPFREEFTSSGVDYTGMNPASIEVVETHAQYYQLDMNIDKDNDEKADMVVWYCLGNNRNSGIPNDVRNGYYLYSVGNVTYTGMGHYQDSLSGLGLTESEAKLFVNTIMASLNSGKKNPSLNIISNKTNKNSSVNYLYRIFDQDETANEESDVEFYFYGTDVNIVKGDKDILVEYYYEVDEDEKPDVTIGTEKAPIYLKKIERTGSDRGFALDSTENLETEPPANLSEVEPGDINRVKLDGKWVNEKIKAASAEKKQFRVYISAQTMIDSSQNEGEYEYTGIVYNSVTFKRRDLFNLD